MCKTLDEYRHLVLKAKKKKDFIHFEELCHWWKISWVANNLQLHVVFRVHFTKISGKVSPWAHNLQRYKCIQHFDGCTFHRCFALHSSSTHCLTLLASGSSYFTKLLCPLLESYTDTTNKFLFSLYDFFFYNTKTSVLLFCADCISDTYIITKHYVQFIFRNIFKALWWKYVF